jgi:hypothetical protein
MSKTKEAPQKLSQVVYQEVCIERKLNFREFYPVEGPFGYIRINIERKTGKLLCLTSARSSPAWVRLDAAGTGQLDGKSASGFSEVFVSCAAVDSVISKEATVQEAP